MRFTFYAALFAATATATYTEEEGDNFADYLWSQIESGEMTYEEGQALAEQFADDLDDDLAETDAQPQALAQPHSQPIMTDLKWLGGKMLNGAKAVGGAIDSAYDATKAGIKKAGSAVINAPGNMVNAGNKWLKKHNFKAQTAQKGVTAAAAAAAAQGNASKKG